MNSNKKIALGLGFLTATLILIVFAFNQFIPLGFVFKGSFETHKNWYPRFFLITFLVSKTFFPVCYGICLSVALKYWRYVSVKTIAMLLGIQTLFLIALLEVCSFGWQFAYSLPLSLFCLSPFLKNLPFRTIWSARLLPGLVAVFLFLIYIALCLYLPRFHPFAKYAMFNKFPESTYAFLLRNERGDVIPLGDYSTMNGDNLYTTYEAICEKHGFAYGDSSQNPGEQQIAYSEMMQTIFSSWKKPLPFDSVFLYRIDFQIINDKVAVTESKVAHR